MSSDLAIKVENLSKCYHIYDKPHERLLQMMLRGRKNYYKEFWALKDVSFEVKKGETVGIVGKNGSGKSTLLQMICGTLNPTSGSIRTNGRIAALLELGSGFNPEFTGRENVYLNASVLGLTDEEINERFDKIVEFADIDNFIEQPIKTYSSGMVVRLAFAVVAHVDADILIIDEALSVGDAFFTQKCIRFLRNFMKTGTIVFVSHDTGAVANLCTSAFLLDKGILSDKGTPKEVCEKYLVKLSGSDKPLSNNYLENNVLVITEDITVNANSTAEYLETTNYGESFTNFQDKRQFGTGEAKIVSVNILQSDATPITWVSGGEIITLEIKCLAVKEINRPIIGFEFKDRLGQILFAENTFLTYQLNPKRIEKGEEIIARFKFNLPLLPTGDYSISPAIAEGTQDNHVVHHWLHDALIVRVHSPTICFGLLRVPMKEISLQTSKSIEVM